MEKIKVNWTAEIPQFKDDNENLSKIIENEVNQEIIESIDAEALLTEILLEEIEIAHVERLQKLLKIMDVPKDKLTDYVWLSENLVYKNFENLNFLETMGLVKILNK